MTLPTTLYDREEAARRALATQTNVPGYCQLVTRTWVGAPSAGDVDGDGASDAEDGWKSEPAAYRHTDRRPPRGTPVSYLGGSSDNGHRALSLGPGGPGGAYMIRSTDAAGRGRVGTVPLDWPERVWGLTYVGWSPTCDGYMIPVPKPPQPPEPPKPKGPSRLERVRALLRRMLGRSESPARRGKVRDALNTLPKPKPEPKGRHR